MLQAFLFLVSLLLAESSFGSHEAKSMDTATEMYLYAWPLVMSKLTRESMFYMHDNVMYPLPVFPNPNLTAIVKPNVDTLYDACWINHESQEDLILTIPDTTDGVYYLFPLMDAWTNVIESPGWRTTGKGAQKILIRGPFSNQTDPAAGEYDQVIRTTTSLAYLLGRTNVENQDDLRPTQKQMFSYSLDWGDNKPAPDASENVHGVGTPVDDIFAMTAAEFFNTFAELLIANPPVLPQDDDIVDRMLNEYGLAAGQPWNFADLAAGQRASLTAGVEAGTKLMYAYPTRRENGWTVPDMRTANFSTNYYLRAYIGLVLYAANLPQDAVYYVSDMLPGGGKAYTLEFSPASGGTPPTNEFWSVTLYSEDDHLVPNLNNVYSVSSQQQLKIKEDGTVHITVSIEPPADLTATNWLPAPTEGESFQLTLRVYWGQDAIFDYSWLPPAVQEV